MLRRTAGAGRAAAGTGGLAMFLANLSTEPEGRGWRRSGAGRQLADRVCAYPVFVFQGVVLMNVLDTTLRSLVERDTFALLAVLTRDGDIILRPIGGRWGSGIVDAVHEMAERYPGCKMRLFEQNCDWKRYFEGIVSREQVLPYAEFSPETKAGLEVVRRKALGWEESDWPRRICF